MTLTPSTTTAAAIVTALSCGRSGCACQRAVRAGSGGTHCPAHDDRSPSLSVSETDGKILFHCQTGCTQSAVFDALRALGFFQPEPSLNGTSRPKQTETRWRYLWPGHDEAVHVRVDAPGQKKRMWWEPRGVHPDELPLYRAGDVATLPGEPVLVCEGERKTDIAAQHGFLAVSVPGGASQRKFGTSLHVLQGRDVVLLPDNDGPGRELMAFVAGMVRGIAASVRVLTLPGLPEKGDLADWFAAGHTADELRALLVAPPAESDAKPQGRALPKPKKARDLQLQGLPEVGFAVGGILPEGVTLCAGRPKQGKSFLALNLAIAVAAGGKALGDLPVTQGDVLYLTLEGGEHGFLPRLNTMLGDQLAPDALEYQTEWPRLDEGGAELVGAWLAEHERAKLVVIDTLARVRPPTNSKSGIYEQDYAAVQSLIELAGRHHVAILVIHHTRKSAADDPLDTVSGSTGLTGAVDAVWILQRVRGQGSATLTISGRNLPDDDLGLEWDDRLCSWRHAGEAADVKRSAERRNILAAMETEPGETLTAREVADLLDLDWEAVRKTMWRMSRSGELARIGKDGYRLAHTSNEESRESRQSPPSRVSRVSRNDETEGTDGTHGTRDTPPRASAIPPARAVYITSPDDEWMATCPDCEVELRANGWCPVCKTTFAMGPPGESP